MKRLMALIFLVFCFLGSAAAHAQALWGGTVYGMSVDEVKAAVGGAIDVVDGGKLQGGEVERLKVDNVQIVGKNFSARFFFAGQRLHQVSLSPTEDLTLTSAELTVDRLIEALRSRYGQEISAKNDRTSGMTTRVYSWMNGESNITLSLISLRSRDSKPVLGLAYQLRVSKGAENL